MAHERLRRRTGIAVSVGGVVLMLSSAPLSRVAADSQLLDVSIDWFLLAGMIAVIAGGLVVRTSWTD